MTERIEDSCGCVFCDVGLEPIEYQGRTVHLRKRDMVPCRNNYRGTVQHYRNMKAMG